MPKSPPVAFSSLESLIIRIRRSPVLASWGLVPDRRAENGLIEGKHLMISGIPPLDSTGLSHSVAQGKVDKRNNPFVGENCYEPARNSNPISCRI